MSYEKQMCRTEPKKSKLPLQNINQDLYFGIQSYGIMFSAHFTEVEFLHELQYVHFFGFPKICIFKILFCIVDCWLFKKSDSKEMEWN